MTEAEINDLAAALRDASGSLSDVATEVHENKEISEGIRKTTLRLLALTVLVIGVGVASTYVAVGQANQNHQTKKVLAQENRLLATLNDCLDPGGKCKQRSNQTTDAALVVLSDLDRENRLQDNIVSARAQGNAGALKASIDLDAQAKTQLVTDEKHLSDLENQR